MIRILLLLYRVAFHGVSDAEVEEAKRILSPEYEQCRRKEAAGLTCWRDGSKFQPDRPWTIH